VLFCLLLLGESCLGESMQGSICVATIPYQPPTTAGTPDLFCRSGHLSLKLDNREPVPWPHKVSLKIDALDTSQRHKVTVLCDGKPQQSFAFRFSDFKSPQLCLLINDLYQTVQLWELRKSPWCR